MVKTAILCLAVAAALMLPSIHGMATQTDSLNYLSIAENIAHGRGFVNQDGKIELVHPFGYSLAMAPLVALGLTANWAAFMVNWLSVAAVGFMAWLLICGLSGKTGWQTVAGAVLCMATMPLMIFANQALTEAMDAALVMLFCWLCWKSIGANRVHWILNASLCGVCLWFTRYQGVALICGAGIFLGTWRDRAVVILPPLALSALGYLFVPAMRPLLVPRGTMLSNVLNVPIGLAAVATGGLALALLAYLVKTGWQLRPTKILAGAVVSYVLSLLVLVVLKHFDPLLDVRLFVPITAPVLVLLIGLSIRYLPTVAPYVLAGLALDFGIFLKGAM